ncbi:alpha/beta fold hydrolase [Puniceicoccaceae bacterium K14]|nr:alpha/beta fold hydrolase [Puniceicoccaceae bacterium K14]
MPLIQQSAYQAPWFLPGAHIQTIVPSLTRLHWKIGYARERLELEDGDFIDVDWMRSSGDLNRLMVVLHGLEGNSRAPYIVPLARKACESGYDVVVMNFRGCSGEPNRLSRFYHSGDTDDLHYLLTTLGAKYQSVSLVGFSLGGNIVLKYLGKEATSVPSNVSGAVAFSVPCDLAASAKKLESWDNKIYMKRFMDLLCDKIEQKESLGYPRIDSRGCRKMKTFAEFDNEYTAPLHGFDSAMDYWEQSSSLYYMEKIARPVLLVNASNDPFLPNSCLPKKIATASEKLFLEIPETGGHCAFPGNIGSTYWFIRRALQFLDQF